MAPLLKLNLGCGLNLMPGCINVDKFGTPDLRQDLERFPWPWETSSVGEVFLIHVLEHLGGTTEIFLGIIKELFRVCAPGATIQILVPHPRHNDFLNDPTHVRGITPEMLALFSKARNHECLKNGSPDSPLALYLDVDFTIVDINYALDEPWWSKLKDKQITSDEISEASRKYNNVIKSIGIVLKVNKEK